MDEPLPPGQSDTADGGSATPETESGGWTRRRALALATGALTLTSGCSTLAPDRTRPVAPDDWAGPGGDPAGTYAGDPDAPTAEPQRQFVTETDGRLATGRGQEPAVHDGTVYAGALPLVVFDAETGKRETTVEQLEAPPVVATETPYRNATLVGLTTVESGTGPLGFSRRRALVGVNPAPGVDDGLRRRWRFPGTGGTFGTYGAGGSGPPVVVAGGRVIAGGSWTHPDGTQRAGVVAVSAADGELAWAYHVPDELDEQQSTTGDTAPDWYPTTRPAVRDGTVYAADVLSRVHAVDAETGTREWVQSTTGTDVLTQPRVTASESVLLFRDRRVVGLDPDDGSVRWRYQPPERISTVQETAAGAVAGGQLFLGLDGGDDTQPSVVAVDARNGTQQWRTTVETISAIPTVTSDADCVYVPVFDRLHCLDAATGRERWRVVLDGETLGLGTPVPANGSLYATGIDRLVAFEEAE